MSTFGEKGLQINAGELKQCLNQVQLVDVRQPEEFEESRIDGCKLIPLGELMDRASEELSTKQDIVVYCARGMRSLEAALILRSMGFPNTRSLEGGIDAWFSHN